MEIRPLGRVGSRSIIPLVDCRVSCGRVRGWARSEVVLAKITSCSAIAPTLSTQLSVYKCLTVRLPPAPQVTKLVTKDVIRARRAVPGHGFTPAVPSQFDTVLARESNLEENLEHP